MFLLAILEKSLWTIWDCHYKTVTNNPVLTLVALHCHWFSVRQVSCPICLFVSNHFCPVCGQLFSQCLLLLLLVFYVLLQGPLQFFAGFCHLVVRFCCTLVCVLSFWWSCLCFLVSFVLIFAVGLLGFVCLFYFALKRSLFLVLLIFVAPSYQRKWFFPQSSRNQTAKVIVLTVVYDSYNITR